MGERAWDPVSDKESNDITQTGVTLYALSFGLGSFSDAGYFRTGVKKWPSLHCCLSTTIFPCY